MLPRGQGVDVRHRVLKQLALDDELVVALFGDAAVGLTRGLGLGGGPGFGLTLRAHLDVLKLPGATIDPDLLGLDSYDLALTAL